MDYDVLRGTKDNLFRDLYENIPLCFKERKFINMNVESIPKEQEIILYKKNGSLIVMKVFKVVYYERKIFVIVNNTEGDLRSMEKGAREQDEDDNIRAISS
jgi:hypothetical protein